MMDFKEFEKHVADYIEGLCDEALQKAMDEMRRSDPACDRLARLHENILAALTEAPEVKAPAGLSDKILATVEAEEKLLAEENKSFRNYLFTSLPAIASIAAAFTGIIYVFKNNLASFAQTGLGWIYSLYGWLNAESNQLTSQTDQKLSSSNRIIDEWLQMQIESMKTLSAKFTSGMEAFSALLNYPIDLPLTDFSLPASWLFSIAVIGVTLWYYREEIFFSVYPASFSRRK